MDRAMLLAVTLALAPTASAADEPVKGTPAGAEAKPPGKPSTKASKGKASASKAPAAVKGRAGGRSAAPAVDPAQLAQVFRAKGNFMFAVEACERPDRCDKQLRAESEEQFVKACLECAPQERCEAERQVIRDGDGKRSYNPCSAP